MNIKSAFTAPLLAIAVVLPVAPATAGMDREAATAACRKEMRWAYLQDKQKRSPATQAQLEACVAAKVGK